MCILPWGDDSRAIIRAEKSRPQGKYLTTYLKPTTKNMGGYQENFESHHAKLKKMAKITQLSKNLPENIFVFVSGLVG